MNVTLRSFQYLALMRQARYVRVAQDAKPEAKALLVSRKVSSQHQ